MLSKVSRVLSNSRVVKEPSKDYKIKDGKNVAEFF